ncbi:hypothetical protein DSO57_1029457 [Entomophthora muscae]|uniref:Uncharacterized protein n=1 Tax=Entomophthora muscae TaxID=34485 RepID=A0ACC2SDS8_9FUNG|nr:hypothetical protein DSO57_1029457 [Entomophthora muscae]
MYKSNSVSSSSSSMRQTSFSSQQSSNYQKSGSINLSLSSSVAKTFGQYTEFNGDDKIIDYQTGSKAFQSFKKTPAGHESIYVYENLDPRDKDTPQSGFEHRFGANGEATWDYTRFF